MINITGSLVFLLSDAKLHAAVRAAIDEVINILDERDGNQRGSRTYHRFAFALMFEGGKPPKGVKYDKEFLDAVFETVRVARTRQTAALEVLRRYSAGAPRPTRGIPSLRRGLKLLLVSLWTRKALLIPSIFNAAAGFDVDGLSNPLLKWVRKFDPEGSPTARRLHYYGHRLVWATTWQLPSDVNLSEAAALARARALYEAGESSEPIANATSLPISLFLAELHKAHAAQLQFDMQELQRFSNWTQSHSLLTSTFEDFIPAAKRPTAPRLRKKRLPRERELQSEDSWEQRPSETMHDVLLRRFKANKYWAKRPTDWRSAQLPVYPAREHVDLSAIAPKWIECFNAYLHHRAHVKGYREDRDSLAALNFIADYIFLYLPWWKELFPATRVALPSAPKEFSRLVFVARHTPSPVEELPATMLELAKLRRPSKASEKVLLHQLSLFFSFVATHYAEDEDYAGASYRSPLDPKFDAPRVPNKSKTTKEVIPKQIYGYLLFYCYALEDFGMHLESLAREGRLHLSRKELRHKKFFNTGEFGFVPEVKYRDKTFPLKEVPNVYMWDERTLSTTPACGLATVYMPHTSVVRMLTAAVEMGLRLQAFQWLDRTTWRSLLADTPPDSYTFKLRVNTDKTNPNGINPFMVYRVKKMFDRQEAFQKQFVDANKFGPIDYEGRANSPFAPIQPLFRSTKKASPIGDHIYSTYWSDLMVWFEAFYRSVTGEKHVTMFKLAPVLDGNGEPVISRTRDGKQLPHCLLSVRSVHTPHACRATFATNRKGLLSIGDTRELLGHSSDASTAHYDKPSEDDLRERLAASDREIISAIDQLTTNSPVHVRADKPDSALAKSFSNDRAATVKVFKFMPSIAFWSTDEIKENLDGLKMLQEGPMSRIRFFETHICPVGAECPVEIIQQIGEPGRCGACPLGCKCIDHLTAISAKCNQLKERIKYQHRRLEVLGARKEPSSVLDAVWDEMELDVNELIGWQLSREVLELSRNEPTDNGGLRLLVEQPEVVRRHLKLVTRPSNAVEFILQRIADSNAYPSMTTPQVQLAANQIKRRLLAGKGLEALAFEEDALDEVHSVAALLELMVKTESLTMADVAARLAAPVQPTEPRLTRNAPQLPRASRKEQEDARANDGASALTNVAEAIGGKPKRKKAAAGSE